jgi:hypothetical protein
MKKLFAGLLVAGLVAFTGCNKSDPGGPGASPGSKRSDSAASPRTGVTPTPDTSRADNGGRPKNIEVDKKNTFKLSGPGLGLASTDIKQGATETVKLKVERQDAFKETVTLEFRDDKGGLKFEANPAKVAPGDKDEVQVKVMADEKAALGKHKVIVTATPTSGEPVTHEITLDVKAK